MPHRLDSLLRPRSIAVVGASEREATVAHCPTSNSALGSGLFPLERHVAYDVRVALASAGYEPVEGGI